MPAFRKISPEKVPPDLDMVALSTAVMAACVAVEIGLLKSEVLSTFPRPT